MENIIELRKIFNEQFNKFDKQNVFRKPSITSHGYCQYDIISGFKIDCLNQTLDLSDNITSAVFAFSKRNVLSISKLINFKFSHLIGMRVYKNCTVPPHIDIDEARKFPCKNVVITGKKSETILYNSTLEETAKIKGICSYDFLPHKIIHGAKTFGEDMDILSFYYTGDL
jgi:hypothetical protein